MGGGPKLSPLLDFAVGGVSAVGAIVIVNPADVVKTRLQLQGEGGASHRAYSGAFDALRRIGAEEGLRGLQRGLAPAALFQLVFKSAHFGFYALLKEQLGVYGSGGDADAQEGGGAGAFLMAAAAGGASAAFAASFSSPFWMIKTRMQAQSATSGVGHQHGYEGFLDAWRSVARQGALFHNVQSNMIRLAVSGSVQLAAYDDVKQRMLRAGMADGAALHTSASVVAAGMVVAVWQPFDTTACRVMNQPQKDGAGALYRGFGHCMAQTVRAEGLRGLWKGSGAQYLRIGPYTVLLFVFAEQIKAALRARAGGGGGGGGGSGQQ